MQTLFQPWPAYTLASFRIAYGCLLLIGIIKTWLNVDTQFPEWEFWTLYQSIEFVRDWPKLDTQIVFATMTVSLTLIACGFLTRLAALIFSLAYSYQYLFDPTHFNNHYYLIAIFGLWLSVIRSDSVWSLRVWLRPRLHQPFVPRWHVLVLQVQLAIVYFFGGIAKFNSDWLQAEPISIWLSVEQDWPIIGPILATRSTAYFVAYFGLVFDLTVPFFLFWRKTRPYAIVAAILFHLANSQLFNIGVFPWLGVASLVVFLEPETPCNWVRFVRDRIRSLLMPHNSETKPLDSKTDTSNSDQLPEPTRFRKTAIVTMLVTIAVVQLVLPWRHWLYDGNVEWNEEGKNFSWRMMLSYKDTFVGLRVVDPDRRVAFEVDQNGHYLKQLKLKRGERTVFLMQGQPMLVPEKTLTRRQRRGKGIWGNPRLLVQYARYIADEAKQLGIRNPQVYADAVASLNGRPYQYLVDPDVDLAAVERPWFETPDWIVPLQPNQPLGNYTLTLEEMFPRVQAVIEEHRSKKRQAVEP